MKRISEKNKLIDDDLFKEFKRIERIFSINHCMAIMDRFGVYIEDDRFSIERMLDEHFFSSWHLKGKYINVEDMRNDLGIDLESMHTKFSKERFLMYIQYVLNGIIQVESHYSDFDVVRVKDKAVFKQVFDNCVYVLKHLNYKFDYNKKDEELFIVENNVAAEVVAEESIDIAHRIREYIRIDTKGDLERKADILCFLYKELEKISSVSKNKKFEDIYKDTTLILNKAHIRHANKQKDNADKVFHNMSDAELEKWYDRAYELFLTCMMISKYLEYKLDIEDIRKGQLSET